MTPDNAEYLLCCPFCGGGPEVTRQGTRRQSMIVTCSECGAQLESSDEGPPYQWNDRIAEGGISFDTGAEIDGALNCECARVGLDAARALIAQLQQQAAVLTGLLARYRHETPLGHQPHMIAHQADAALEAWADREARRLVDHQTDSQYRAGFMAGWNAGVAGDEALLAKVGGRQEQST